MTKLDCDHLNSKEKGSEVYVYSVDKHH